MNQGKKISFIALFAIMISSFSLMVSYGVVTSVIDNNENIATISDKNDPKPLLRVNEIKEITLTNDTDKFTMQPAMVNNKVKFGLNFNNAFAAATFNVDLLNEGTASSTISEIKISGLEELEKNVKVEVIGVKVGDIIAPGASLNNIIISTEYFESKINEDTYNTLIEIPNIQVEFIYE